MKISVGVGGTHKLAHSTFVGVSGAWKRISGGWIGVGGAWKRWHAPVEAPDVYASDTALAPSNASAMVRWKTDGIIDGVGSDGVTGGAWLAGGDSSEFEIYFAQTSGSASGTFGSWLSLGSNRSLSLSRSTLGVSSAEGTYSIRTVDGAYVLDTGTWGLSAAKE